MDYPSAEEALKKSFGEVNPGLDDAALTKLAHTATNTLSALGRLTPEPPPEKATEKPPAGPSPTSAASPTVKK